MKTRAFCTISTQAGKIGIGVYGIGADQAMHYKLIDGTNYLPSKMDWQYFAGGFDSAPTAAPSNLTDMGFFSAEIFCLGVNYDMWHRTVAGWPPSFLNWQPIGGKFNSPPDAANIGISNGYSEGIWIIVGLIDNQPHLKIFNATNKQWFPSEFEWFGLGGILIYEPVIAKPAGIDSLDIFGIREDRQMYFMSVNCNQLPPITSNWQPIGGCFISPPAVVKWSKDRIDVFGIGMDNQMYHRAWEYGGWIIDWEPLGGEFDSQPEVVSWGKNRLDIFGLGTDDQMYHKAWDGNQWLPSSQEWEPLGGVFKSAPTAITLYGTISIFCLGTDNQMYHKVWDGNQWLPSSQEWESLGGEFIIPRPTQLPSRLDYNTQILFHDADAVGSVDIKLFNDGRANFNLNMHANSFASYSCSVACAIIDAKDRAYTFQTTGYIWGTDLPGSRDFNLIVTTPPNASLSDNWNDMFSCGGARFGVKVDVQTFPPGGLVLNVPSLLQDLVGNIPLTIIPLFGQV